MHLLNRIVDAAELTAEDAVVEVGPGLGALTDVLAHRAASIIAVEVDRDLIAPLRTRFGTSHNVTIIEADVLETNPSALLLRAGAQAPYVVVANLPYNIAAPVIRSFLEAELKPRRLVVMVQMEVAEAIVARPGSMGLLSVATQLYADARIVMKIAPGAFTPPPKVRSAVVRIDPLSRPRVDVPVDAFFRVVRAGFGNPRKQLRNSLSFGLHVKQEVIDAVTADAGADATVRPQTLSIAEWESITRAWLMRTAR